jgi:hypothetical protein
MGSELDHRPVKVEAAATIPPLVRVVEYGVPGR